MKGGIQIEGLAGLARALRDLGDTMGVKVLRSAGRKAFKPVVEEAKRLAPYDEKSEGPHLRDSLSLTTKKGRGDTAATVGMQIRAPKGIRKTRKINRLARGLGATKTERKAAGLMPKNPRRYWHLVEFGTAHSAPKPFARVAMDHQTDSVLEGLKVELRKGIDRANRKRTRRT